MLIIHSHCPGRRFLKGLRYIWRYSFSFRGEGSEGAGERNEIKKLKCPTDDTYDGCSRGKKCVILWNRSVSRVRANILCALSCLPNRWLFQLVRNYICLDEQVWLVFTEYCKHILDVFLPEKAMTRPSCSRSCPSVSGRAASTTKEHWVIWKTTLVIFRKQLFPRL